MRNLISNLNCVEWTNRLSVRRRSGGGGSATQYSQVASCKLLKGDNLIILLFSLFLELNYWFVAYCVTNNIISIRHAKVVVEVYEK